MPTYTKLTPQQTEIFLKSMLSLPIPPEMQPATFPPVQNSEIDPVIPEQIYAVISFSFDDENVRMAQKASDLKSFIKVRYVCATREQAESFCEKLTRESDSLFPKCILEVGHWTKLSASFETNNEKLIADDPEQQALLQQMYNDKQQQRAKDIEEVEERRRKLLQDSIDNPNTPYDHMSLDNYITKRVSQWNLDRHMATFQEEKRRYKQAKKALIKVKQTVKEIESQHPEYLEQYKPRFEQERRALGFTEHPNI